MGTIDELSGVTRTVAELEHLDICVLDRVGVQAAYRATRQVRGWVDVIEGRLARRLQTIAETNGAVLPEADIATGSGMRRRLAVDRVQHSVPVPAGVRLTLSDYSHGMVTEAVNRVRGLGTLAAVGGRQADAQALPFGQSSFDRVIANHMLYHLPDPARGVSELARVVRRDGQVMVATNGRGHMRELWQIRAAVFGIAAIDQTVDVFGVETGFAMLREAFDDVRWLHYTDELRCTDPDDVMAYICSTPPAEDADDATVAMIRRAIDDAFTRGGGTMVITKDTGSFICRDPRRR